MNKRITKPEYGNKFYNTRGNGGYSQCIKGSPTDPGCDVYANCVGHACGRFNEIIGEMRYPTLNCNAENFIERAIAAGLKVVSRPTLGGIMVAQKGATLSGNDGAGHVWVVEEIYDANGSHLSSESGYGSSNPFWNTKRTNANGRWGLGSDYKFRGCIVNPAIGEVYGPVIVDPEPKPELPAGPSDKFNIGDRVIVSGPLYVSSYAGMASGNAKETVTTITRKNPGGAHPYNTTGDLGWMDEANIRSYVEPTPEPYKEDFLTVVKKTIRGDYGNMPGRKSKVEATGNSYSDVQHQVDLNYHYRTTRWDNIRLY